MDRPYIKKMIESYLIDRDLDSSKFHSLNEIIVESIDFMRDNYECAYVRIHEMDRVEQQRYIYNVLDNKLGVIQETFGVYDAFLALIIIVGTGGVVIAGTQYGHKILTAATNKIVKAWMDLHKYLGSKELFREHKVINQIISANFADCRKKAGFTDETDLDIKIALNPKRAFGVMNPNLTVEQVDMGEALKVCYIDYIISIIASMSIVYSKCIEETGETKVNGGSSDHGMGMLLSFPTGEACQVLYDQLREQHEAFMDILDVFYKDDRRERQNWLNRLDQKVRGASKGEHLRSSIPRRSTSSFNQQGRHIPSRKKEFLGDREINPTDPVFRR